MSTPWKPTTEYGVEAPDVVNVITPPPLVLKEVVFPKIAHHYRKMVAGTTWTITHDLNFYPNVTVVDSAGTIVEGEITYTNRNSLSLTFQSAFSGNAYLS
jgi:hypothetical protein